jgi:hypothetical protein
MNITKELLAKFVDQLAKRFLTEVEGYSLTTDIDDLKILGVSLVRGKKASEIGDINADDIHDNEVLFYSKTKKDAPFNLLKHFRNCASHSGCISLIQRNGKDFFLFEDKGKAYGKSFISMRAVIQRDMWDEYIDNLYKEALKDKQITPKE